MTKKNNEGALLFFALNLVLAVPFAAWSGFVISKLWRWFVVPLGVMPVGVWEAAGLYLLVHFLVLDTTLPRDSDKSPAERFGYNVGLELIIPAGFLGFGFVYHLLAT